MTVTRAGGLPNPVQDSPSELRTNGATSGQSSKGQPANFQTFEINRGKKEPPAMLHHRSDKYKERDDHCVAAGSFQSSGCISKRCQSSARVVGFGEIFVLA
ncbi:MAG: hypothetical protein ABR577_11945 [Pyrinomonadaceae bacterium]